MRHDAPSRGKQQLVSGRPPIAEESLPHHKETRTNTCQFRRITRRVEVFALRAEDTVVELECTTTHSASD